MWLQYFVLKSIFFVRNGSYFVAALTYKMESNFPLFLSTKEEVKNIFMELGIKESVIQDDADALLEWFQKQPHLCEAGTDRDFLERTMIIAKGSREKAKQRINNYYRIRSTSPEIIQARLKVLLDGSPMFTFFRFFTIPILFEGKRLLFIQYIDPNPESVCIDVFFRDLVMMVDLRMKYDISETDIWIMDFKNTSISHYVRSNLFTWSKGVNFIQKGIGQRVCAIYLINPFPGLEQVLTVFRTFTKQKIMDRIEIIKDPTQLLKYLPKSHLPSDYGGDQQSFLEYTETFEKMIHKEQQIKQYLIDLTKRVSDETKRPDGEENMAGTFKKLDID